jgi:hypothetical protein
MHPDLKRMARLRAGGLSFGAAIAIGLGMDHAKVKAGRRPVYNGAGLAGDRKALESDFNVAIQRLGFRLSNRAG